VGASPAELVHSPAVSALLGATGARRPGTASQAVGLVNLGTGGLGGGAGGCEFCDAQRQVERIEDEVQGLRSDLRACAATPSLFKPDCAPRLRFQIDRLVADMRRRQQAIAAEQVELERVAANLRVSAQACEKATSDPPLPNATGSAADALPCSVEERRAIASLRRAVSIEIDTRVRLTAQSQQRKQLACLWAFRGLPLTEAVAAILSNGLADFSPSAEVVPAKLSPITPSLNAADVASGDSSRALDALLTKVRSAALPRSPDGALDVNAMRTSQLSRLLDVCAALTAPALVAGASLRACLCTDAEEMHSLALQATSAAVARAAVAANLTRAAADRAVRAAQEKLAAERAAREAAKERLFARLQSQPEYARLVADAMTRTGSLPS
jgi:hypothetical protein